MVATRGKNDRKEMYEYLGDKKRIKLLETAFKQEYSNLRIVIVVDMWITGFDVPCLTYLYNDKPIQIKDAYDRITLKSFGHHALNCTVHAFGVMLYTRSLADICSNTHETWRRQKQFP